MRIILGIVGILLFIGLWVVGLLSVVRDLLHRCLHPSPIWNSREEASDEE